jgi:hypothetical protein
MKKSTKKATKPSADDVAQLDNAPTQDSEPESTAPTIKKTKKAKHDNHVSDEQPKV